VQRANAGISVAKSKAPDARRSTGWKIFVTSSCIKAFSMTSSRSAASIACRARASSCLLLLREYSQGPASPAVNAEGANICGPSAIPSTGARPTRSPAAARLSRKARDAGVPIGDRGSGALRSRNHCGEFRSNPAVRSEASAQHKSVMFRHGLEMQILGPHVPRYPRPRKQNKRHPGARGRVICLGDGWLGFLRVASSRALPGNRS
jgi:hypothetical protein